MNILSRITLQSQRKNKTRTIVTIIGIMLSAAMICAVTTFVSSIRQYLYDISVYNDGDWHGVAFDVQAETVSRLRKMEEVTQTAVHQTLGYARIDSQNPYKPYLYVVGAGEGPSFDMLSVHLTEGRYPQSSEELILPSHLLSNGGKSYRLGDTLTLSLGERMLNGQRLLQTDACYTWDRETGDEILYNETMEEKMTRTYTVVGFFQRPGFEYNSAPGYTAITLADPEAPASRYNVYFQLHRPGEVYSFMEANGFWGDQNSDVLMFLGVFRYDSFNRILVNLAAIVIFLIVLGSISLIYNAFAISVSERTKQFGLLSSVGATKRQLRASVRFEALCVSAIGIPAGILVGIGGIGTTLLLLGGQFASLVGGYTAPIRVCVSWEAVVIAVVIALVTVLLSALIPARRAAAVSAVEAIRQSGDIQAKKKQVRTSKLSYILFGLPAVLANKYYKRSRKKYRATVISLFMSIVLFISASAFSDYLVKAVAGGLDASDYDLYWNAAASQLEKKPADELLSFFTADSDVTEAAYVRRVRGMTVFVEREALSEDFARMMDGRLTELDPLGEGLYPMEATLCFVNDAAFDALLLENGLNAADYRDAAAPLALFFDVNTVFDGQQERFITLDALRGEGQQLLYRSVRPLEGYTYERVTHTTNGEAHLYLPLTGEERLYLPYAEGVTGESVRFQTGKALETRPFFLATGDAYVYLIYPASLYAAVVPAELMRDGPCEYYISTGNHGASFDRLQAALNESGLEGKSLVDIASSEEVNRNIVTIIQVFAYGFVVLISLISAANVFNTISTNISLRRREFAMLRSVGMTEKGFRKMMDFECLRYGFKALLLGLPAAIGIIYLIYRAVTGGYELPFFLPWRAIFISVFSVFLVVFSTMLYVTRKLKRENLIDALKNENL